MAYLLQRLAARFHFRDANRNIAWRKQASRKPGAAIKFRPAFGA
jgi:hypothetical protein